MVATAADPAPGAAPGSPDASRLAADTLLLEAVTKRAEAERKAATAEIETMKARFGLGTAIGASPGSNTVTLSTNAGAFEASFLAAHQIGKVASCIVEMLARKNLDPSLSRFVLFAGAQRPNFADLALFEAGKAAIDAARARAATVLQAALDQGAQDHAAGLIGAPPLGLLAPSGSGGAGMASAASAGAAPAVAAVAANAALDLASKLASYFQTEYTMTPAPITGVDADLLAVAVAARLDRALYPARWPIDRGNTATLLDTIITAGADLAAERQQAEGMQKVYGDAPDATKVATGVAGAAEAVKTYAALGQAYDALLNTLTAADANGVPRLLRVSEQMELRAAMNGGAYALMLQLGAAAGTVMTKRSIWTFLGRAPVFVSGGIIVSFLACDQTGTVRAAGQIPLSSGFRRLTTIGG